MIAAYLTTLSTLSESETETDSFYRHESLSCSQSELRDNRWFSDCGFYSISFTGNTCGSASQSWSNR